MSAVTYIKVMVMTKITLRALIVLVWEQVGFLKISPTKLCKKKTESSVHKYT